MLNRAFQQLVSRWPAWLGSLLVLLGFVDQKRFIDRVTEAKQKLDASRQENNIESLSLQLLAADVASENILLRPKVDTGSVNKPIVNGMYSGELFLINSERRIATSLLEALPEPNPDLEHKKSDLERQIKLQREAVQAYLRDPYPSSPNQQSEVEYVLLTYGKLQALVQCVVKFNATVKAIADEQIKVQERKLDLATGAQYVLFFVGWALSTSRKLGSKGDVEDPELT